MKAFLVFILCVGLHGCDRAPQPGNRVGGNVVVIEEDLTGRQIILDEQLRVTGENEASPATQEMLDLIRESYSIAPDVNLVYSVGRGVEEDGTKTDTWLYRFYEIEEILPSGNILASEIRLGIIQSDVITQLSPNDTFSGPVWICRDPRVSKALTPQSASPNPRLQLTGDARESTMDSVRADEGVPPRAADN